MLMELLIKYWSDNLAFHKFHYNFIYILMILFGLWFPLSAQAQTDPLSEKNDSTEKFLQIKADKLISDRNSRYVLFSGNVHSTYGEIKINSENLKVIYLDESTSQAQLNDGKIDKIIATGHVVIDFDNKTAYCEQAVYTTETKTIILTGDDTRIESEGNYINGEKITIRQPTGQITIEGGSENRVNAVFKPEKNSPDLFGGDNQNEKK